MTSLGCLCLTPASFEIFGCKYVCISQNLPRFHGPRIQALLVAANQFRITLQREKQILYPLEHSTVDKTKGGEILVCVESHVFTSKEHEWK